MIYTFKDGVSPVGTPVLDRAGNLYGTTFTGGAYNQGAVYKLKPQKKGKWIETTLYSFKNNYKDGSGPYGGIVLDAVGNIYGCTVVGGTFGDGTVFEVAARGWPREKVLWNFNSRDGDVPQGNLILDSAGHLYGTASGGGTGIGGVVFEVTQLLVNLLQACPAGFGRER